MAFPSFTKTWHNDTYDTINPNKRTELSQTGKTVIISGGGSGIGRGISHAFANAGASRIAVLGRRDAMLKETKKLVEEQNSNVTVTTHPTDITDATAVKKAADDIGKWDILVSNAAYLSTPQPLVDAPLEDWWQAFEVNVKGVYNLAHFLLPNRNNGAIIVGVMSGSVQSDQMAVNLTGYNASKLAAIKLVQDLGVEYPDLHVVSFHPGVVKTDMQQKSGVPTETFDTPELPGHFAVWLCSDEAKFLRSRFLWTNWDADEIMAKKDEIEGTLLLTANCVGWPFT